MNLYGGRDTVSSCCGIICSIILTVITFTYFFQKAEVLYNRKDNSVMVSFMHDKFDSNEIFDHDRNGIQFAAALSSYGNTPDVEEDERYAKLVVSYYQWGRDGYD